MEIISKPKPAEPKSSNSKKIMNLEGSLNLKGNKRKKPRS